VPHVLAWCCVSGAVAPTTGERFCLERPSRNAESCQRCTEACAQAVADRVNSLLLDHSGAHTAARLTIPAHVRLVCLPPYGPALNPMERVWRHLHDDLAWQQFPNVQVQHDSVGQLLPA
jgi:DDE superfamily endonuclease